MNLQELKQRIDEQDEPLRAQARKISQCVSIGGQVRPEYAAALERAQTLDGFLDNILGDDSLRFERAWALAARMRKTNWLSRFEPVFVERGIPYRGKGVYTKLGEAALVLPVMGVGRRVDLYLFADGAFNEDAADYFTSIEGRITIEDTSLEGTFDVFRAPNALILEQWEVNERGQRVKAADLAEKFGMTG